jgi:hypothetical protein
MPSKREGAGRMAVHDSGDAIMMRIGITTRRAKLFAVLVGSAVLGAAMVTTWESAEARGGRGHASVGRASGGFFGGRSGPSRASIRPLRASSHHARTGYRTSLRPVRNMTHGRPDGIRRGLNAGARQAARDPERRLVRAQKRYKIEREQFGRNRYNQLSALNQLQGRYVKQGKAYSRATRSLLGKYRKYGKDSRRYRAAERKWQRESWKLAAAKQSYGDQAKRARNIYRHDRRQYRAAERRLGRATENYFRSQPGNSSGPRSLTDGVRDELRPIRR